MTRPEYIYHSTCITVRSTDSTYSKVLDQVYDSITVHVWLIGLQENVGAQIEFVFTHV